MSKPARAAPSAATRTTGARQSPRSSTRRRCQAGGGSRRSTRDLATWPGNPSLVDGKQVPVASHYKWIALSNTTLGTLMATINQSIVLIALPQVFHGIGLDPLSPGNTGYLLWMFMGFLVVSAVLVVSFGRLGDMFGRVRMYTLGFA